MQNEAQMTTCEVIRTGGFWMLLGTVAASKQVISMLQNQRVPRTTGKT